MPLRAQSARVETKAANLQAYRDPKVVSHYAALDYLTACERLLFDTYIKPGMAILDSESAAGGPRRIFPGKRPAMLGWTIRKRWSNPAGINSPNWSSWYADASDLSRIFRCIF